MIMENIDPNQQLERSRFSLADYSSNEVESDESQNVEVLFLPERSCMNHSRLSLTSASASASPPLPQPQAPPQASNHHRRRSSGIEDDEDKQYGRRISLADNLFNSSSPSRTAISGIADFVETSIVLRKDKNSELGISIAGGSDTYLESVVVVEVHPFGAAYKDGRLRKGDLILAVNDISFREITWKDAVRVLKEVPSPLKLMVLRENPQKLFTTSQSPSKFITVELRKSSIKDKLGLSFMQRTNGRGVFITYVQPGSIAARQGKKIMQGDQICEVNGQNVRECNQKDVANIINNLDGEIVLLLGRSPPLTISIQEWCRKKAQIHWRTRTSTWSAYGGNKDKVQNQRPSLPAAKDQPYFSAKYSPDREAAPSNVWIGFMADSSIENIETEDANMFSRSSSVRSRVRLSVVIEDHKTNDSVHDEEKSCKDNPLLPSIQVTEF